MPIKHVLTITPFTRINDEFVKDSSLIDASPINKNIFSPIVDGGPNSKKYKFQAEFYKNIACDIVSETVINYPYPYISEKTMRPIACKRMFIVLGAQHSLKLLHIKGFETFGDFIDESYDTISNPEERFLKVVEEIKKICKKPNSEVIEYLESIKHRLNKNFETLKNLQQVEVEQLKKRLDIND
mgnify:CR=1 FL=1